VADTTVQEQIVREAPEIEAYKLGLLQLAKERGSIPVNIPAAEVAGLSPEQQQAVEMAQFGVGAYLPFLTQSQNAVQQAGSLYAGLPMYGMQAVGALQAGRNYALSQAGGAINQAAALSSLGLGYGTEAARIAGTAATTGGGYQEYGSDIANIYGTGAAATGYMGAQSYDPNSVYGYMNPYQQGVTENTLREMRRQADIGRAQLASQAVRAGAFGGSREGIQRSEYERNVQDQMARTAQADYAQNYLQAQQASMNAFQNQQARMQQAGNLALGAGQLQTNTALQAGTNIGQLGNMASQAYQNVGQMAQNIGQSTGQLGMSAGQLGLQANQALGQAQISAGQLQQAAAGGIGGLGIQLQNLGQAASGLGQGDVSFLYNVGSQLQALEQKKLDAQRATALQTQYEPFQRIAFMSDIYKGAPSSQQTIAQSTAPTPSAISQATGLGIAGLSAYNLMK
jgi:hypothetical protein